MYQERTSQACKTELFSCCHQLLQEHVCQAMREALDTANAQLAQLTEQHEYLQQMQQPLPQVQLSRKASSVCQQSATLVSEHADLKEQVSQQQSRLDKQTQDLERQHQELTAAGEQLQALTRLLAIKDDSLAYASRHSFLVEQQVWPAFLTVEPPVIHLHAVY